MNKWLVKKVIYPIHERIKNNSTLKILNELEKTQWLSPEKLYEIQLNKFKNIVNIAYNTTSYYRKLFDSIDLKLSDVKEVSDCQKIPFLRKEIIRVNSKEMLSKSFKGKIIPYCTGGSTGEPLQFFVDNLRTSNEWAMNWRARRWWDVDFGDRTLNLWGSPIEINSNNIIKKFRDYLLNYRLISAFDLGPKTIPRYVAVLNRFKPAYLFGYSSSVYHMASFIKNQGLKINHKLKAVFTTADILYDDQRKVIEEVFKCKVGIEYGSRDGGFIAHECPLGGMHIFQEGMVVEIVDKEGNILPTGKSGEIVLTNLDAYAMPFLRYKTGDIGSLSLKQCDCGVNLPLLECLEGRKSDNIITRTGKMIHGEAFTHILRQMEGITQFQFIQLDYDQLELNIVKNENFNNNLIELIGINVHKHFDHEIQLKINFVDEIMPSASGKTRYIISEIK